MFVYSVFLYDSYIGFKFKMCIRIILKDDLNFLCFWWKVKILGYSLISICMYFKIINWKLIDCRKIYLFSLFYIIYFIIICLIFGYENLD